MSLDTDRLTALRTLLIRVVREQTGLHERLAVPIAQEIIAGLQQHYGGMELYIPSPTRRDRVDEIRQAVAVGLSPKEIAQTYGIHRATVYRALRMGGGEILTVSGEPLS